MLVIILLTFLVISSMAQVPGTGPCTPLKVMNNFNQTKYTGIWYGYAQYSVGGPPGRCKVVKINQNPDGTMEGILSQISNITNNVDTYIVQLNISNGTMTVVGPPDVSTYGFNISFLGTDYVSYLVKGTCNNVGPSSLNYYWVETRSRSPSQETLAKAAQVLKDEGIPQTYFIKEDQSNCPGDRLGTILNRVSY